MVGRVLAAGEPVEGIQVEVQGGGTSQMRSASMTDDRGQFRISGLYSGKYRVKANPMMMPTPPEIRTDGTVEANYVATYYPNSLEMRTSGRVEVRAGEEVTGVEIRLAQVKPVRVSGSVSGLPKGVKSAMVEASQDGGTQSARVNPDGTFEIWRLPPGKHALVARGSDGGMWMTSAPLEIEVGAANLDNLELKVVPPFDLAGRVQFDDEQAKAQAPTARQGPRQLFLRPAAAGMSFHQATVADDGTFRLIAVPPGRYRVFPAWGRVYVKSMELGQVHVDGNFLDLTSGAAGAALEVLLSSAVAEVSGVVADGKGPMEGARVALMSEDGAMGERPSIVTTGAGGGYRFPGLAPGRYRLAAIDDNNDFAPEDYEDIQVTVELHAGDKVTKDLRR
jgi:hypothetical protein